jgi:hypothetical protein
MSFPRDPFVFVARILAPSRGKDTTEVSSPPLQYVAPANAAPHVLRMPFCDAVARVSHSAAINVT